jgi:tetratricopeptide (TPR) repeat protein
MNRNEFIEKYTDLIKHIFHCYIKAGREGLLALEDNLDNKKINERDIFQYGLSFVVDGVDGEIIDKTLSNIINRENDEYTRTIKTIQKEAVLMLQSEKLHPRLMYAILNSYTDISLKDDKVDDILKEADARYAVSLSWRAENMPAPELAAGMNTLARLQKKNGNYTESEENFTKALAIYRKLAETDPGKYLPEVEMVLENLIILQKKTNRNTEAEANYAEAQKIRRKLGKNITRL